VQGDGEPVLLIHAGGMADGFHEASLPLIWPSHLLSGRQDDGPVPRTRHARRRSRCPPGRAKSDANHAQSQRRLPGSSAGS
jgi:hypothetical protein